jgi:hypothetical protein
VRFLQHELIHSAGWSARPHPDPYAQCRSATFGNP